MVTNPQRNKENINIVFHFKNLSSSALCSVVTVTGLIPGSAMDSIVENCSTTWTDWIFLSRCLFSVLSCFWRRLLLSDDCRSEEVLQIVYMSLRLVNINLFHCTALTYKSLSIIKVKRKTKFCKWYANILQKKWGNKIVAGNRRRKIKLFCHLK